MAGLWRKTMLYLGLGPDDDYDDYDASAAQEEPRAPAGRVAPTRYAPAEPVDPSSGVVRTLPAREASEPVTPRPRAAPSVVRTIAAQPSPKPHIVAPRSFNQAQEVADKFKEGQPVILNLQSVDRDLARRLIDFSSGMCYALGGRVEKVAQQVFLLSPANVDVSAEDRRRISERDAEN